jgi:hypothetical protein
MALMIEDAACGRGVMGRECLVEGCGEGVGGLAIKNSRKVAVSDMLRMGDRTGTASDKQ